MKDYVKNRIVTILVIIGVIGIVGVPSFCAGRYLFPNIKGYVSRSEFEQVSVDLERLRQSSQSVGDGIRQLEYSISGITATMEGITNTGERIAYLVRCVRAIAAELRGIYQQSQGTDGTGDVPQEHGNTVPDLPG